MDDFSQKIASLLGDPETMEKIKGLSGMLSGGSATQTKPPSSSPPAVTASQSNGFPSETVGMMMQLAPLLQSVTQEDDSTRLLKALRPFLHEERRAKLDEAVKMLGIMRLLPALKGMKIL